MQGPLMAQIVSLLAVDTEGKLGALHADSAQLLAVNMQHLKAGHELLR